MAETFIRYSETVETVTDAFSFIMKHLDKFAEPNFSVEAVVPISDIEPEVDIKDIEAKYAVSIYGPLED